MRALNPREIVSPLKTPFNAILGGKRLSPEERESRDIHGRQISTRKGGESVVQASARVLKAKFIEQRAADRRGVLPDDSKVTGLLDRGARTRILPEVLVLGVHLDSCNRGRRNASTNKRAVFRIPDVIESQRPKAGAF